MLSLVAERQRMLSLAERQILLSLAERKRMLSLAERQRILLLAERLSMNTAVIDAERKILLALISLKNIAFRISVG
jgi:hypothetical protein